MKLSDLFENVPDIEIKSLMSDSRKKRPDAIFFCVKGMMFDGHKFVEQAISNGAKVIVHSEPIEEMHSNITYIKVRDVLEVYNKVADAFYGHPSRKLLMFGVTGTNGKSSIACIIRDVMNEFKPTGYVGTISIEYGSVKLPPLLTTPDIDDLHGILSDMVDAGMKCCALEASSIGIEQGRVDAIDFDVAMFTNLTHDHLDYHGTMKNYFEAKKKMFDHLKPEAIAITNVDDPYGLKIVEDCQCHILTYGIDHDADYQATNIQLLKDRTKFNLKVAGMEYLIETNLVARFNIYNLLAAIAAMNCQGISMTQMLPYLKDIKQVEGRMQKINEGQPFNIIVDFAHTPDGIEKVCQYAAAITPKGKRIIAITGSAGKRDTIKRPIFGQILDRYCDMIILTEDDPRNENPKTIAQEIASGIKSTNYVIIVDRYDAIREAVEMADPNDTIIILGKGDEKFIYREFGREPYEGDNIVAADAVHKYYFGK
ncbi:MAG: UDP-N-acetylmuramoyl-L-alanyl-D-glutamate--2,6-diaminopimelate ligase [Solobacterium sp.]|nr:UDP-N-acetylmuramoyl-L-alanyl-D-glutamate--2,6-diaminopimelate ligase [Solobacterium sp.]MCH4205256.1 UDP-N-acetylmuramoyl-L-alanyl-D-glutamate--2,6-diaminopimelate ligase [Solobacterium sp.]MCH4226849.1 UDP-N-acetylmuramoyl-L-alanyl-D-glutamate--2,6-diaminopimelate ligase [Solobacterium sp.]MCH4281609.1 UDP-N-acetylmuramoyl-L-alanyl-D-glutamate--2,6-diaminopimelate ligase [Solobacterium sp.]